MMKTKCTIRRMLAFALSLLLVMAVAIPAFAEEEKSYTITIRNAEGLAAMENGQFTAYQIFTGAIQDDNSTMINVKWADAEAGENLLKALKAENSAVKDAFASATNAVHVAEVLEENSDEAAFLQAFAKIAKDCFTAAGTSKTENGETSTIEVDEAGYYLIVQNSDIKDENGKNGVRSSFILYVINHNPTINLKADIPTVTKTVSDQNAGIGDIVKFTLTATLPNNFSDYETYYIQFKDTLSSGLELVIDNDEHPFEVKLGSDALVNGDTTYYTTDAENEGTGEFTVTIQDLKAEIFEDFEIADESTVTVTYYAKVKTTATNREDNKVDLTYSNDPNNAQDGKGTSVEDIVYVHNYNVAITKQGTDLKNLTGAEFYLTKTVDDTTTADSKTYYATADANGKITGWVEATDDTAPETATKFVSDEGKITISGLDANTYTLIENAAPGGYGTIADVTFTIGATLSKDGSKVESITAEIVGEERIDAVVVEEENNKETHTIALLLSDPTDSNLPNTGGIGRIIFYIVGGLMVTGAIAYLVIANKKAKAQ